MDEKVLRSKLKKKPNDQTANHLRRTTGSGKTGVCVLGASLEPPMGQSRDR
jgi:hypothetical protein